MIFDCHTHIAEPEHISGPFLADAQKAWGNSFSMKCTLKDHREALRKVKNCSGAIVLAMDAPSTGFNVPNEYVAEYVKENPTGLFGFASVDPNRDEPHRLLESAVKELGLKGLKLAPFYQDFHPLDRKCYPLYAKAQELNLPIMWHQGTSFVQKGPLEKSRPVYLDPVSRSFPELKMVIAHLGHPWMGETISVVRKNPNVYTDISALGSRPWQMYNGLIEAIEYGIEDKLLFGTDFPFFNIEQTIEALRGLNKLVDGTNLPRIPDAVIDKILYKNTPELLGLQ
ncbi:amidohydrolase family protein [Paenibacillus mendelii]|uniref:Amidohydrolase family protein n=1 Tax=Paenibacillus mendelii TaxID=206163 RepID=A0ABV6J7A5_9BACL|nr:amidohydrolase family protein [Paenibacillus mendelii]